MVQDPKQPHAGAQQHLAAQVHQWSQAGHQHAAPQAQPHWQQHQQYHQAAQHQAAQHQAAQHQAAATPEPVDSNPPGATSAKRLSELYGTLVYRARAPAYEVLSDVSQLSGYDQKQERRQLWWRRIMLAFLIGGAAGWFTHTWPVATALVSRWAPVVTRAVPAFNLDEGVIAVLVVILFFVPIVVLMVRPFLWARRRQIVRQTIRESTGGWFMVLAGIGAIGALGIYGIDVAPIRFTLKADAANLLVLAGIVAYWIFRRSQGRNFEDRRYELCAELLSTVARDSDPRSEINLHLDLGISTTKEKQSDEKKLSGGGRTRHIKVYTDPWLELRGRFLDGTRYAVVWTDVVKTQRSVSGRKNKTKQKHKKKMALTVQLKVKPSKVAGLAQLENAARQALRLPSGCQLQSLKVTNGAIGAKISSPKADPQRQAHQTRMVLMGLFQVLGYAKKLRKRGT